MYGYVALDLLYQNICFIQHISVAISPSYIACGKKTVNFEDSSCNLQYSLFTKAEN